MENNSSTVDMVVSESFILAVIGIASGITGGVLSFILKSRCSKINCFCISCERNVLEATELEAANVRIQTNN